MSEPVQAWTLRSIVEAISAEEMSFIPAALSAFRSDLGKTELADAFSGYKLQLDNRTHSSNKLSILERLREVYPNDRIVCVNAAELDLQGYVKAHTPQASLAPVLDHDNPEQFDVYDGNCRYSAPERRLDESPGVIRDLFNFVQYRLVWQNQEHTVFFASWTPPAAGCVSYWFFVSSREMRSDSSANVPYTCTDTVAEILLRVGKWTSELHEEIYVFDDFRWKKSKSLFQSIQGATWDDVIMDAANKQGLIEDVQGFFKKETQQLYEQYSVAWKRGIILHGSPGNGKTISIKALVNALAEISVPALYVRTFANQRNMPQLSVAMIFEKARSMAPCLLILEDIDSLVEEKVRSYFLNELDGLESNDGILIIGSTNHLEKLDPAVAKRPSRFDRKYHFALPDREQRIAYAEYWRTKFSKKNDAAEFPLEACTIMADLTHGFSFAYCKELFVSTMLSLARVKGPNGDQVLASLASSAEQTVTAQSKPESEPGNAATADEKAPQPQENLVAVQATPMSAGLAQRMANFGASSAPRVSLALKAGTRDAEPRERNTVPASSLRPEDLHRIQTRLGEGLPEGLKDCVLLQVMLHHVAILIREMDTRAVE